MHQIDLFCSPHILFTLNESSVHIKWFILFYNNSVIAVTFKYTLHKYHKCSSTELQSFSTDVP